MKKTLFFDNLFLKSGFLFLPFFPNSPIKIPRGMGNWKFWNSPKFPKWGKIGDKPYFWKTIVKNPRNHFAHWNRCRFFQASYFIIVIKNRQEKIRRQHLSHLCYNSHFCSESFKLPIFHQKNFWRHPPTQSFFGGDLSSKKVAASFETIITYDVIFLLVSH